MSKYLIGTCDLTRAQALSASRKLSHINYSPTNPDAVLAFLAGIGLSGDPAPASSSPNYVSIYGSYEDLLRSLNQKRIQPRQVLFKYSTLAARNSALSDEDKTAAKVWSTRRKLSDAEVANKFSGLQEDAGEGGIHARGQGRYWRRATELGLPLVAVVMGCRRLEIEELTIA